MADQAMSVWRRHRAELRLSVRMTVAGLAAFVLGQLLGLPQSYLAVLTAIIVTQANVGASLKATLDRLVATLGGAVWGAAIATAMPHAGLAALALALAPTTLLGAWRPTYRVASTTATIVLLSARTQQVGALTSAFERVLDIGAGGVVALAVTLLVLPTRAYGVLAETAAETLELMAQDIITLFQERSTRPEAVPTPALTDRIRAAVVRVEAAAEDATRERGHGLAGAPDSDPLVRVMRRLRHDLIMVRRAASETLSSVAPGALESLAARTVADMAAFMRGAAEALVERMPPPALEAVAQALAAQDTVMSEVRRQALTRDLSGDAVGRIFGLAFALEQLGQDLGALADRVREMMQQPAEREVSRT